MFYSFKWWISAVLSAWPSCTHVQKLSARIEALSKVSGTWTLISQDCFQSCRRQSGPHATPTSIVGW